MHRLLLVHFLAGCSGTTTPEPKTVTIPLDTVWGLRIPRTQDLEKLLQDNESTTLLQPLLDHIRKTWDDDHGLASQGTGRTVLQQFFRHEFDDSERAPLVDDRPVSVILYTRFLAGYLELASVQRTGFEIVVSYRFIPHQTTDASQHIAIIPLGKLPKGEYSVRVNRAPIEKKLRDAGRREPPDVWGKRVTAPFTFSVNAGTH